MSLYAQVGPCRTCIYWTHMAHPSVGEQEPGKCYRYPPVHIASTGRSAHPATLGGDGCGEYQPRIRACGANA